MPRPPLDRRLSVAPMMDWTDRHCRYFHRLISPHALLYSEMVTTGALLFGDIERHLTYNAQEHPVALQLGGSEPAALAKSARLGAEWGYDEINLNCGCPSDRVQRGRFGACLMAEPALVADCVKAMADAVDVPVTVKCRIGIDDQDSYDFLRDFVGGVIAAGSAALIIHARKAWLSGLSPKQNRDIPPLRYDVAARLKADFPDTPIVLNGGLIACDQIQREAAPFDGVMIGRAAYQTPWLLAELEGALYGTPTPDRRHIIEGMAAYAERQVKQGARLSNITRHMMGLYQGHPGARAFRRLLSEQAPREDARPELLLEAAGLVMA